MRWVGFIEQEMELAFANDVVGVCIYKVRETKPRRTLIRPIMRERETAHLFENPT